MITAKMLIRTAIEDNKASESLYQNGLFPASLFHFLQASEKAIKALGLIEGTAGEADRKISHNSLKIYQKATQQMEIEATQCSHALLTKDVVSLTRYPSNGKEPKAKLNRRSALVKFQPMFVLFLKKALLKINKLASSGIGKSIKENN